MLLKPRIPCVDTFNLLAVACLVVMAEPTMHVVKRDGQHQEVTSQTETGAPLCDPLKSLLES